MKRFPISKRAIHLGLIGALSGLSANAMAGGFQLFEASAASLGNAFAGTGATANDASISYYNPAGMVRIKHPQLEVSGTGINLGVRTRVNSSTTNNIVSSLLAGTIFAPLDPNTPTAVNGATSVHPGGWDFVPAFNFVYPVDNGKFAFGFGANAPFGLETKYPETSAVRYFATKSHLEVIDVGPTAAYLVGDGFSVGAGLDVQYLEADLNQHVPVFTPGDGPVSATDAVFNNRVTDFGYGWHAGIMEQFTPNTRVGFDYRSAISHHLRGTATLEMPNRVIPIPFTTESINTEEFSTFGRVTSDIKLPATWDVSVYHDVNQHWAVMGSLDYTQWSSIQRLTLNFGGPIGKDVVKSITVPLDFRNTFRIAVGADYRPDKKWVIRVGTAYDESPVHSPTTRTFRLPDNNRIWVACGAGYQIFPTLRLDVGYAHLFVEDSKINRTQTFKTIISPTIPVPIVGNVTIGPAEYTARASAEVDASVNEIGAQLTWDIV